MTESRFTQIMNEELHNLPQIKVFQNRALAGLKIIAKYLPAAGVEGADHDVIYSVDVNEIVKAGITEEDAIQLRQLNWMIDDGYLAKFV
jgi:hypothetical protein